MKHLHILPLIITIIVSGCGSSHARSEKIPVFFESAINLEVDGEPITLRRVVSCSIHRYSKAGGSRFAEISQNSSVVSHVLPTGEVVIGVVPRACHRAGVLKRDKVGKPIEYGIIDPLPKNFLPYIAIADKAPIPDKVIVYASKRAYEAKASRIVFKGVTLDIAKSNVRESEEDDFYWFIGKGGRDNGPLYVTFGLTKANMFPELKELVEKHASGYTDVTRLLHKGTTPWFSKFYQELINDPASGRKYKQYNKIFPSTGGGDPRWGSNTIPSAYDSYLSGFRLKEDADFASGTLEYIWDEDYLGMVVMHRMPYEYFWGYQAVYENNNLIFNLPGDLSYLWPNGGGAARSHVIFNPADKNIYRIGVGTHQTWPLKGKDKNKYNYWYSYEKRATKAKENIR